MKEIKTSHLRDLLKDVPYCERMIKVCVVPHQVSELILSCLQSISYRSVDEDLVEDPNTVALGKVQQLACDGVYFNLFDGADRKLPALASVINLDIKPSCSYFNLPLALFRKLLLFWLNSKQLRRA